MDAIQTLRDASAAVRAAKEAAQPVEAQVAALLALKTEHAGAVRAALAAADAAGDAEAARELEAFLGKPDQKKRQKARKAREARERAARDEARRAEGAAIASRLRIQRKIHSLLHHEGAGTEHRYHARLAEGSPFRPGCRVVLSEKWDGTTAQATCEGVFKRFDNFKRGDPRKHGASEAERYRIERVDLDQDPGAAHLARAVAPFREALAALDAGLTVYFEAVGASIGRRYAHLGEDFATIRVFDFARDGRFVPFAETVELARRFGLPLVGFEEAELDLPQLLARLAGPLEHEGLAAPLEGYVVRLCAPCPSADSADCADAEQPCPSAGSADSADAEQPVAKVRVEDLETIIV